MRRAVLLCLSVVLCAAAVAGHVPRLPGGGTVDAPRIVTDSQQSQVFYDRVDGVEHFQVRVAPGEALSLGLTLPADTASPPVLRVTGPGVNTTVGGAAGSPVFEPFAPSYYYPAGSFSRNVEGGTYLVTVEGAGRYGLVVGAVERFSPVEWVAAPLGVLGSRAWEGSLPLVLFLTALGAAGVVWRVRAVVEGGRDWLVLGAAAVCVGSGVATLGMLVWSALTVFPGPSGVVTVVLGGLQLGVGAGFVRVLRRPGGAGYGRLFGLAVAGAAVWSGYLLGPFLGGMAGFWTLRDRDI